MGAFLKAEKLMNSDMGATQCVQEEICVCMYECMYLGVHQSLHPQNLRFEMGLCMSIDCMQ